jgi:hypothetical protein
MLVGQLRRGGHGKKESCLREIGHGVVDWNQEFRDRV